MPNTTKINDTDLHDFDNGDTPLEADFDKNPQVFKEKINSVIDDLSTLEIEKTTKEYVDSTVGGVVLGQIPDDTITDAKMAADMKKDIAGGIVAYDTYSAGMADLTAKIVTPNTGKLYINDAVPGNGTLIKEIIIGDNYQFGYAAFLQGNTYKNSDTKCLFVNFTRDKLSAISHGVESTTDDPYSLVVKSDENTRLNGTYNGIVVLGISFLQLYNVWIEDNKLKIEIRNTDSSSQNINCTVRWVVM